jgi:ubiquinone/menaquinone biosynthesis C-methylase UbiE
VTAKYDTIGRTYSRTRQPEPRWTARIHAALGDATTVVNIGAGSGSYEPADRFVVAVEPSVTMLAQRAGTAAPVVRATAEYLPFADDEFDAAMATLTLHHWHDLERGANEMLRVAARQVLLYFEPFWADDYWLITDYFPQFVDLPSEKRAPGTARLRELLDVKSIEVLPVPADCHDGVGAAFWNRPERYLDPDVRAGISGFAQLDPAIIERQTEVLRRDLESGAWDARYGHLRGLDEYDAGYRLAIAGS